MSITRSYNKHTDTYYAYETSYVWDEARQKKVQRKQCIGQFDPDTNEVIPNGKRGRPRKEAAFVPAAEKPVNSEQLNNADSLFETMAGINTKLSSIEKTYKSLEEELRSLGEDIVRLKSQVGLQ